MRNAVVFALAVLAGPVGLRFAPSAPSAALAQSVPPTSALRATVDTSAALVQSAFYQGDWSADALNTWRSDDGEPRVQFNLRSDAGDSRWGFGVRIRDLAGLPPAAFSSAANDVQFSWTREAGTFRFTGSFDQGRGHGTYTFTPDQSFTTNMAAAGYKNLSIDDIVRMAVIDVTMAHVRGLAQVGYANLTLDELIRFRIHKVTPDFIQALDARGYKNVPAQDLVKMRIHNVTPAEIDQLKALGLSGMAIGDLIKFRIHRVTPDFIKSMRDLGFVTISEDQLIKLRIHNVDAQFIRDARADGFAIASPGDAIDLAIHGPRWRRRGA